MTKVEMEAIKEITKAIVRILKKWFPSLTTEESVEIAMDILSVIEFNE